MQDEVSGQELMELQVMRHTLRPSIQYSRHPSGVRLSIQYSRHPSGFECCAILTKNNNVGLWYYVKWRTIETSLRLYILLTVHVQYSQTKWGFRRLEGEAGGTSYRMYSTYLGYYFNVEYMTWYVKLSQERYGPNPPIPGASFCIYPREWQLKSEFSSLSTQES